MEEIWKDIPGFEDDYQASNLGRIRRVIKNKELFFIRTLIVSNRGYHIIHFSINGISKMCRVHRLVAQTFIPNPENKPQINHIDGNKINNHIGNLEWCTAKENDKHAVATGLSSKVGERNANSKLKSFQVRVIRKIDDMTEFEIAKIFNISRANVGRIKRKEYWKHIK